MQIVSGTLLHIDNGASLSCLLFFFMTNLGRFATLWIQKRRTMLCGDLWPLPLRLRWHLMAASVTAAAAPGCYSKITWTPTPHPWTRPSRQPAAGCQPTSTILGPALASKRSSGRGWKMQYREDPPQLTFDIRHKHLTQRQNVVNSDTKHVLL